MVCKAPRDKNKCWKAPWEQIGLLPWKHFGIVPWKHVGIVPWKHVVYDLGNILEYEPWKHPGILP